MRQANDFHETPKYFQEEKGLPRDLNTVALVEFQCGKVSSNKARLLDGENIKCSTSKSVLFNDYVIENCFLFSINT